MKDSNVNDKTKKYTKFSQNETAESNRYRKELITIVRIKLGQTDH
jgi:uncharacterized protein YnzC (UPF0291/DUF896 family)